MKPYVLLATALFSSAALAAPITLQGTARGTINHAQRFNSQQAMQKFSFNFVGSDHHIENIAMLPTAVGTTVSFHDKNLDDYFKYEGRWNQLPANLVTATGQITGSCEGGRCSKVVNLPEVPSVFVITGFRVKFIGTDHQLDEVGIQENHGLINVYMNDRNDDDDFVYTVNYAYVRKTANVQVSDYTGRAAGDAAVRTPRGQNYIGGFRFNFNNSDHHIKALEVDMQDGNALFRYSDVNRDDAFSYSVRGVTIK